MMIALFSCVYTLVGPSPTKWEIGLNKYSHDAGACLISTCGQHSIIVPNERLSRLKHDGGDTAAATRHALEAVGSSIEDVVAVCANNHHHRVAPFEGRLPWSVPMGLCATSALSDDNLLPGVPHFELSHHLAHVWCATTQAPFERGLVVVMDGMGETFAAMQAARDDTRYMHDLRLPEATGYVAVPQGSSTLGAPPGHREAESAYLFEGSTLSRVFKRWVPQRSPSELYNHGFENLESVGALFSRVSSHIFGDWNACGKVMGLAPWAGTWADVQHDPMHARLLSTPLLRGKLDGKDDEALCLVWDVLEGFDQLPPINGFRALQKALGPKILAERSELPAAQAGMRGSYAALAARVQMDLEEVRLMTDD